MAEFETHLHPQPFAKIRDGSKTIEMRLNDEKRRKMAVGDVLTFSCRETGETFSARLAARLEYPTFAELLDAHDPVAMGYGPEWDDRLRAGDHGMYAWYSPEEEARWGVVGLQLEVIHAV